MWLRLLIGQYGALALDHVVYRIDKASNKSNLNSETACLFLFYVVSILKQTKHIWG